MSAQVVSGRGTGEARREQFARIGIGMAMCALMIVLVAAQILVHRAPATMAPSGQTRTQERSPAVDAALLEAALDLGPVTSGVCTTQANGTPACYQLHVEGLWTRQAQQGDGTWLTVGLVIPRTEGT